MKDLGVLVRPYTRDIYWIITVFILASAFLYGYYSYFTPQKMDFIFRNMDGPAYVVVAKTFYNVNLINKINPFPFLAPTHYAFQFPLYPLFIRMFSFIGYKESMIFVSQLFALLFTIALYFLVKLVNPKANALVVALLSIFYTPRWFIVSHVGSIEPVFIFFITLFLIFFMQKKYLLSALCAGIAQLAKPHGIIFFVGIGVYYCITMSITWKKTIRKGIREFFPFLLIPLGLIGVFTLYHIQYHDFFIYLSVDKIYHQVQWPPLQILVLKELYYNTIGIFELWKEALVFNYILYLIPIAILLQKKFYFFSVIGIVFYLTILLYVHADIARYFIPLLPLIFLGYSDILSEKPIYLTLFLCTPMVFLYALSFINYNIAPL